MFSKFYPFSSLALTFSISLATVAAIVAIIKEGFCDDPAALN